MENYKIRVNGEAESKQAQELFFELGYVWTDTKCKTIMKYKDSSYYSSFDDGDLCCDLSDVNHKHKEITLAELRDLVVLKRNDVADATHTHGEYSFYVGVRDNYFFHKANSKWEATWKSKDILKPIEKKEMKEYLRKNSNDTYSYIGMVRPEHVSNFMIEIPQGAECLTQCGEFKAFWKDGAVKFLNCDEDWDFKFGMGVDRYIELKRENGCEIVWKRHTHPEELPFIDDEPKITTAKGSELDCIAKTHDMRDRYDGESDEDYRYQLEHYISRKEPSLNDQYAEIEKVRKKTRENNHYFIDVSDVDEVDFYEIAKRYNVTDPAIQHILKKCLAIGNRGHKDLETDLMDILKTAKRALRINGFGEPK